MKHDATPMSREIYKAFKAEHPEGPDSDYLAHPFEDERFTVYYTNWYLGRIADIIKEVDPEHGRHINPHQILRTLPEYDFVAMEDYLTSLGSSMHASWHFGDFSRNEYPLGVGVMSDIIATSAGKNPWWITEMQGGPVTASGNMILCPSSQETKQAVWTGIFSGTKGVMFWTLNARKAVREAGEWALLDFAGGKSDRLEGISELASVIDREKDFFDGAVPAKSEVYILFSKESFWVLNENVGFGKTNAVSRSDGALAAPMIAAYKSLSASGLSPVIQDIASFDFDPSKTVVLPNVMALQDKDVERLCKFVEDGGTMVSTGMTWYYDETMGCRFMENSPVYKCLGGRLKEYSIGEKAWTLDFDGLDLVSEHWSGTVIPTDAEKVIKDETGRPIALMNRYGKGTSWWIPSMVDIGSRNNTSDLDEFYRMACDEAVNSFEWKFNEIHDDVYSRILKNGDSYMMLIVNKSDETHKINMSGIASNPAHIDGEGKISRGRITVPADGYIILKWNQ
jgi:beta-galactosidase